MQCNDDCCENREGKRKWKPNRVSAVKNLKESFGKLGQQIDKVRKRPKHEPGNSPHYNTTTNEEGKNIENAFENIETNIKNVGVGFKEKDQPKHLSHLDKLNDGSDTYQFYTITLNNTEPSSLHETNNNDGYDSETEINAHEMIDDDQEPSNSDESFNSSKDDFSTTKDIKEFDQGENKETHNNGTESGDGQLRTNSLVNDEAILHAQEPILQEEEDAIDDTNDAIDEPVDGTSEPGAYDSAHSNEDEDEDETSERPETDSSEQVINSLDDSSTEPSDVLLDGEGIEDVGKFGRKRDMVLRKNNSS